MDLKRALSIFGKFAEMYPEAVLAGSARRGKKKNLHDVDIILAGHDCIPGHFKKNGDPMVQVSVGFDGEQVDLYAIPKESLGAMLLFLTGSKLFNIKTRARAKAMGLVLNQKGLWKKKGETMEFLCGETEEEILEELGLTWVPPKERSI